MEINPKDLLAHTDFIGVPLWLASRKELSWGAKVVFARLVYLLARGMALTQTEIGEGLGLSQSGVKHYIEELKKKCIISVTSLEKGTWDRTAKYTIVNQPWFPRVSSTSHTTTSREDPRVSSTSHTTTSREDPPTTTQEQEHKEQKEQNALQPKGREVTVTGEMASGVLTLFNRGRELRDGLVAGGFPEDEIKMPQAMRLDNLYGGSRVLKAFTDNRERVLSAKNPTGYLLAIVRKNQPAPESDDWRDEIGL